ncbi:hypothetical protein PS15p_208868 [Mucor circinelloides]
MFLNGLYTDGYTCRVLFARRVLPSSPEDNICLELGDFSSEEVNKHFRPCTVDPGRRDPFVSYHGGTDIRRLSSIEYYNMGGSVTRMKKQQKYKQELGIEKIETDIPSPKTASVEQFVPYVAYMLQHMNTLFDFYGFDTSKVKWLNYLSSQQVIEESVNILINGGKKYNKGKRKKTRANRKRRRRNRCSSTRAPRERSPIAAITRSKRKNKACFEVGDKSKMPLVIFGDGLKNKDHTKFRGLRHGVSNKIYKQLQARERIGELLLVDINEFKTSKICNNCLKEDLENLKIGHDNEKTKIHQVLKCKTCNIYWNRDVMASKNMLTIATSIWCGNGRPQVFKRHTATSNVVVVAHSGESAT